MPAAKGELWVADDVTAFVEDGHVTISIQRPLRSLPKELAYKVADPIWFEAQLRKLELARRRGETATIPLTDRLRRSYLRLGGGFLIVQGKKIMLFRRTIDAPRRASEFCECGGIFEVGDPPDPFGTTNDFIASMLKESPELALVRGDRLYVPNLVAGGGAIEFQPPDVTTKYYDEVVFQELKSEIQRASLPISTKHYKPTHFFASILSYERSAKLQFASSPAISVDFTAESDTSSLEFVGVLNFPENLDWAALAYLENKIYAIQRRLNKVSEEERQKLEQDLEIAQRNKTEMEKELEVIPRPLLEYWDTECAGATPLNREIHLVDIQTGDVDVWYTPSVNKKGRPIAPDNKIRSREVRKSSLWTELSRTHLESTSGRYATEKVEKAVKMHCPLPWLQPLITL